MQSKPEPSQPLLTVCQLGRMGDIVTSEPIYRHLHDRHPNHRFRWYTRQAYAGILCHAPFIDEVVVVKDAEEYLAEKVQLPPGSVSYELNFRKKNNPEQYRTVPGESLLAKFCREADLDELDETPVFHFPAETGSEPSISGHPFTAIPHPYVVFHCTSQGRNRQWPLDRWQKLARQFFDAGYHVAEVGLEPILRLDHPLYHNCGGEHELHWAAALIRDADLFVGVESGFAHVANAVGAFSIILSGRLRNQPEYNSYCGRVRAGVNCNMIRFYDVPSARLPLEPVREAVRRFIVGDPMSYAECDRFCLTEQIRLMRKNPLFRAAELLRAPFDRLLSVLRVHRNKNKRPGH